MAVNERKIENEVEDHLFPVQKKVTLPKLVVYNRVPKCGSTTMDMIISKLQKQTDFNVINDVAPGMKVSKLSC